jgi:hypothetical protein
MNTTKYATKNLKNNLQITDKDQLIEHVIEVYQTGVNIQQAEGDLYKFIEQQQEKALSKKLIDPIVKTWNSHCYIWQHAENGPVLIAVINLPQSCIPQSQTLTPLTTNY